MQHWRLVETGSVRWLLPVAAAAFLASSLAAQPTLCPDYRSLAPGLDYAHIQMTNWNRPEPLSIHVARLDRVRKDLRVCSALAHGQVFGTVPVSAIAASFPRSLGVPLIAINTGFCNNRRGPYLGAPRGLLIMERELISPPSKYSFWVNGDGAMKFGQVEAKFTATLAGGKTFPFGLNHECQPGDAVLFTHMLGKSTRATNHLELVLEDPGAKPLSWRVGSASTLRIKAVNPTGNTPLSNTIAVLAFGPEIAGKLGSVHPGEPVRLDLKTTPDLSLAITGSECIFPIVQNGKVLTELDSGKYLKGKHPRTAIGFNSRYLFMVVVDGRQKALSMGVFPEELGRLMALLGCTEAMNLDGGGSSTFWADGKTRNSVAGSRERSRSDALIVVRDQSTSVLHAVQGEAHREAQVR